jgi:uncharacterized repeat protein (TIGR02543 family)
MRSYAHTRIASVWWLVLLCWCFATLGAHAVQSVTLAWDPNSETNIAGYKLYYGLAPRTYPNVLDVGNVTTSSIPNLVEGTTYYFAVTAYNNESVESFFSSEIAHTIPYPKAPISISTRGNGTVSPNLDGQLLDVGRQYSITASPGAGCTFSNWSGTLSSTTRQLTFVMQSNMTLVATFVDTNKPTLTITSPTGNVRVTNWVATLAGTASDNTGVAQVLYRVRGGAFQVASGTTSWSTTVNLVAGVNLVEVKSVDTSGNESPLVARTLTNVVVGPITLTTTGQGTVTPNLNGQLLEIGRSYTVTAAPAVGHAFSNWSGTLSSTARQLTFVMQSNMTLLATFVDTNKPTLTITSPAGNVRVTNWMATVLGTASDNTTVAQVLYRVRGGAFQVASGTTSWSATVDLAAGPNLVEVKSVDTSGNESILAVRTLTNVVVAPITLTTTGQGTITPNLNGQLLEIGKVYTVTAAPGTGCVFSNWSGTLSATTAQLAFTMVSNMTLVANFFDNTRPLVTIASPSTDVRVTNAVATLSGTAADNTAVAQVLYRVGGGSFQVASGTTAWSVSINLVAGLNRVEVKALDPAGNESLVAVRNLTNVVGAPLTVTTTGQGSVTPNLNGQWLEIGRSYTMTAVPATGHAFSNWSGTLAATTAQLTFIMVSNMTLVANFFDNTRPLVTIASPATDVRVTNAVATLSGTASDNTAVAQVLYRARGGAFQVASGTTSWSATVNLAAGPNLIEVKSVDTSGNESALAARTLTNVVVAALSLSTTGQGTVTPNLNGQMLEIGKSYTVTAVPSAGYAFSNWSGTLSAATAQLTFTMQSNLVLVANFFDNTRPILTITYPATDVRVTNAVALLLGTASDNADIVEVLYRVNADSFQSASGTTTWSANINLVAGLNRFEVKAIDTSGNESVAVRNLTNVVGAPLTVSISGQGNVTPNLNGQWLEIGRSYTITALPAAGFAFTNWTGDIAGTTAQLTFVMQSNLTLTANFVDAGRPTIVVTSPAANTILTNSSVTLQGTTSDNTGVREVLYSHNGGPFQPASGTTSWTAQLTLNNKTNIIQVKCIDMVGNEAVISHTLVYSAKGVMRLTKRGRGNVTPDLNNQILEIGTTYTMTATPETGYSFADWSGSLTSTNARLTFVMQDNIDLTARFVDSAKPTAIIASPAASSRLTNAVVTFQGSATDNQAVAEVLCSLNGGPFQPALGTTNWTAPVNLAAGTNTIRIKSVDLGGLESPVVSRTVTYVVMAPVAMGLTGKGTVAPRNGQFLEIGKAYTATATPGAGYVLTNWSGSLSTNRASFTFAMQSNLTLTANFVDVAKPTVTIVSPAAAARLTNSTVVVTGRATDNREVAQVLYQLNNAPFQAASGTTNWSTVLTLQPGTNLIRVKAIDATGHESLLVSRTVTYVVMQPIAVSITGKGTVTPANGQWLELGKVYTAVAKPAVGFGLTNWSGSIPTNRAQFSFVMQSNLTLTANFVDVMKPTIVIASPAANARLTNGAVLFQGRASDNLGVAQVLYGLNGGPWQIASGATNWSAALSLAAGPNKLRVKSVDITGWESATLTQTVTHVVMWPMVLAINGNGTVTPNLNGQLLEIGKSYSLTAVPAAGHLLSNWVGSVYSDKAVLTFVMASNFTITAQFALNPFLTSKGTYNGLFYESSGVLHDSSGFLKLTVTDKGAFSASLVGAGQTVPFSGSFNLEGRLQQAVPRTGKPALLLDLHLGLNSATPQITGTLSDGVWAANYTGDRSLWNSTNNPFKGQYTVLLPGTAEPAVLPAGHGYGAVLVDAAGNLLLNGRSADGQVLSQAVPVSRDGQWPAYVPLYTGKGSILSWLTFTNQGGEPVHGLLSWIKSPQPTPHYAAGFDHELDVVSSGFVPPTTNRIANLTKIRVIASEGNLARPVTNFVELTWANTIWNTNAGGTFAMTLNKANGLISGSFKVPGTATVRPFYAALLQNRNEAYGYFLGTNQSGQVRIEADEPVR